MKPLFPILKFFILLIIPVGLTAASPTLGTKGKLIFSDEFSAPSIKKEWQMLHGTYWEIRDGTLHGKPSTPEYQAKVKAKGKGHSGTTPSSKLAVPTQDCIMQFDFKLSGKLKGAHFGFNNGTVKTGTGHVARFTVSTKDGLTLVKDKNSKKPGDKEETLASSDVNLKPETWYTAIVEIKGNEMAAQIVDGPTLRARHERFAFPKDTINLPTRGGGDIYYDNVFIWELE